MPKFIDEDVAALMLDNMISDYGDALISLWHWGDGNGGFILEEIRKGIGAKNREPSTNYRKKKISGKLRISVYERDKYRCVRCGSHKDLSLDHIEPESKGGKATLNNLQTICRSCNSRKGVSGI